MPTASIFQIMKISNILPLPLLAAFALVTPIAKAVLIDHGPTGEYFKDTDTGNFWYDPVQFVGMSRTQVNTFQSSSPIWSWASSTQIQLFLGKSSSAGTPLEDVMGLRQYSTSTTSGPGWLGFYESTDQSDAWRVQSFTDVPDFELITGTGPLNVLGSNEPVGAWLVSTIDPVRGVPDKGSTVLLLGAGLLALLALAAIRRKLK